MSGTPDGSVHEQDPQAHEGAAGGRATTTTRRRLSPDERSTLQQQLGARYLGGSSIRQLAGEEGLSYGFVHRLLTESGTSLRGRGGSTRRTAS